MKTHLILLLVIFLTSSPVWASGGGEGGGHGEKPAAKEGGGLTSQDAIYVNVGPIMLPIITEGGAQSMLTMLLSLQVKNYDDSDKVRAKLPKLMDGYLRSLYGRFDENTMHDGRIVDLEFIKRRIVKVTEVVMGPGVVQDILIQGVAQRPL